MSIYFVASGGGHWKQLMLASSGLDDVSNVTFITTIEGLPQKEGLDNFQIIVDGNLTNIGNLFRSSLQIFMIFLRNRPIKIITTGAAPGLVAVIIGRVFGANTLFIDSVANGEKISGSGYIAKFFSNTMLTQWEELADNKKVFYKGRLL